MAEETEATGEPVTSVHSLTQISVYSTIDSE
jgi:hypothetical protein